MYILLSGRPPFGSGGKNEAEVFAAIKSEALDLASEPWDQISGAQETGVWPWVTAIKGVV